MELINFLEVIFVKIQSVTTVINQEARKNLFISIAAGIFIGAALFDILPELLPVFGLYQSLTLFITGFFVWFILKELTDRVSKSSFAIVSSLAFWLHSILEGTAVALSFGVSFTVGIMVAIGMLLHLIPEFLAIAAILKGEGVSTKRSVIVDLAGILFLAVSALTLTIFLKGFPHSAVQMLGGISGGSFIYIGLMSFLRRPKNAKNTLGFLIGLALVVLWLVFFRM